MERRNMKCFIQNMKRSGFTEYVSGLFFCLNFRKFSLFSRIMNKSNKFFRDKSKKRKEFIAILKIVKIVYVCAITRG